MTHKDKDAVTDRRSKISEKQKRVMMQTVIRRKAAFESARQQLTPEHFDEYDQHYAILWASLTDLYDQFGEMPAENTLLGDIEQRLEAAPNALDPDDTASLDKLIARAYKQSLKELPIRPALSSLKRFLEDRLAARARDLFSLADTPDDLSGIAGKLADEAAIIQSIESEGVANPFPKNWQVDSPPEIKHTTHLPFFDDYLNGGHTEGQVHLVLGPFGSCKTTLGVQLSTREAQSAYLQWRTDGSQGPRPLSYYFFWEGSMDEMRVRALSSLGEIDKDVLERRAWSELSRGDDPSSLKPYEATRFQHQVARGLPVLGELERMQAAKKVLNRCWRAVDMTGDDPRNAGRGKGMAPEIGAIIKNDQLHYRSQGIETSVRLVVVDYIGASVEAHLSHYNKPHDKHLRHMVNRYPLHLVDKVAKPFRCPVWVLHQLNTEAQGFAPGVVPNLTHSSEGRAAGENCHFVFVLGTKTNDNKCVLAMRKGRRVAPKPPRILQIRGELSRVDDLNGEFVLDEASKQIVSRAEIRRLGVPVNGQAVSSLPTAAGRPAAATRRRSIIRENESIRNKP